MSNKFKNKGFTLVELSIVIVIIGFLVAGIAAGSSMIKQAQLRSVVSDIRSYQTSYNNFKARFNNQIPGDIRTAASFWGAQACAVADDDCNGDGDGKILKDVTSTGLDETRPALKHLALAGMISAGIPQVPNTIADLVPGVNAPASKISGVGYYLVDAFFIGFPEVGNVLKIGKPSTTLVAGNDLLNAAFTPEDAYSIDVKLDDGYIVASLNNPLERAFDLFVNPAVAITEDEVCGGGILPSGGVGDAMIYDKRFSVALREMPNSLINSAIASVPPGGSPLVGSGCGAGAITGKVRMTCGAEFSVCGIAAGGYNFSITEPMVTINASFD